MTPRTFTNILKGHQVKHREKLMLHREQVMMGLMPDLEPKERKKPLQELMPFPWEPEYKKHLKTAPKILNSKESFELARKRWDRADGKLKD